MRPGRGSARWRVDSGASGARAAGSLVLAALLPGSIAAEALEAYWPHPAGARWSYDRIEIEWGASSKSLATTVRFTLGEGTVIGAGVDVQPLDVEVAGAAAVPGATLWRQLAIARPDLDGAIAAPAVLTAGSGLVIHDATLLRVAADEIAAYRSMPAIRAWLYTEADVTPGHTFRLQLVPDLADSVFLDGLVLGTADVTTPAGSFAATLRVAYDVDYGWADVLDTQGTPIGRTRSRTRGEMYYAPGVGPVLAREIFVPYAQVEGSPPPAPVDSTFAELRLLSWSLVPAPVVERTWSAMKLRYSEPAAAPGR